MAWGVGEPAAKLWGITDDELKAIRDALAEVGKSKRPAKDPPGDVEAEGQ